MVQKLLCALTVLSLCAIPLAAISDDDMPERYRTWVREEVRWIITDAEEEAFYNIETNELRDKFIEIFWDKRDPTPGTRKNEYKEEHYERIAFANKHFGHGGFKNGWRTERGRIYIMLGPPKERLEYPSNTIAYPIELWFYAGENRIPTAQFFYIMFFKPRGGGDYKIYHPMLDGINQLTWKGNFDISEQEQFQALAAINPELAKAAVSLNPLDPTNSMSSEILLGHVDSWPERAVDGSWATDFVESKGEVDVTYSFKPVNISNVQMLHTPLDGRQQLHYGFLLMPDEIDLGKYDDQYYSVYEVIPSLADKDGNVIFESSTTAEIRWNPDEFNQYASKPVLFTDVIPAIPGDYTFTVRIRNKVSKNFMMFNNALKVEQPRDQSIFQLTEPMLSYGYERLQGDDVAFTQPFKVFNVKYSPSSVNTFAPGETVLLYTELLYPPPVQGVKAVGEVRFAIDLYRKDELVKKMTHIIPEERTNEMGIIYLNYPINTEGLAASADYRLEIRAEESRNAQNDVTSIRFALDDPENIPRPNIIKLRRSFNMSTNDMLILRGEQLLKAGYRDVAMHEFKRVLESDPENMESSLKLAELLIDAGSAKQAFERLKQIEYTDPNNRKLVMLLARASTAMGEVDKAIAYYERLLFFDPRDLEALNSAGALYLSQGNSVKARERLEKSLEIKDDQPAVRTMLDRANGKTATETAEETGVGEE